MKPLLFLGSLGLMTLFACTREAALAAEEKESDDNSDDVDWDSRNFQDENTNIRNDSTGRWHHSRMLERTSTTFNLDEWWFFTTRRPIISYKDFPGKPGVATWKEISPSSTSENRKSRKITNPTAEEVSSSAWSSSADCRLAVVYAILATLMGYDFIQKGLFKLLL